MIHGAIDLSKVLHKGEMCRNLLKEFVEGLLNRPNGLPKKEMIGLLANKEAQDVLRHYATAMTAKNSHHWQIAIVEFRQVLLKMDHCKDKEIKKTFIPLRTKIERDIESCYATTITLTEQELDEQVAFPKHDKIKPYKVPEVETVLSALRKGPDA
jgi:hypothetical protein